ARCRRQAPAGVRLTGRRAMPRMGQTEAEREGNVAEQVYIENIAAHAGQEVNIKGWVYAKTGKGRLQFLRLRDGTGIIQGVAFEREIDAASFENAKALTQESAVSVTGTVRADDRA